MHDGRNRPACQGPTDKTVDLRIIFLGYRASVDDSSQAEIDELVQAAEEADAHLDTEELIPA
jgi:hypothetical protein